MEAISIEGAEEYEGQLKDGKRHGKGKLVFKYGVYEGDWEDGKMQGFGVLQLKTGNRYEGQFVQNRFEGLGKLRWRSGKVYEGQLRRGQMHGKGKLASDEGVFEGHFENCVMTGPGTMRYANGNVYSGEWRENTMWGEGTLTCPDGSSLTGNFFRGAPHGRVVRREGAGAEYSERYCRGTLEVSVKMKQKKKSKASAAVARFIDMMGFRGKSDKELYEDVGSPTSGESTPAPHFPRPGLLQAHSATALLAAPGTCPAVDPMRASSDKHSPRMSVSSPEQSGPAVCGDAAPCSPGTRAFDAFARQRASTDGPAPAWH
eukprot:TRINITY_DN55316_c0_g1_i1.p1 TRINITY_DN55316_c0_g1~~TRINITY_DN55316_c0_g1_i1.p1  ORF type:complete len:342 (+),score=100.51 TRINITY_DN55316_c0_g1_i1:80-1027(+)